MSNRIGRPADKKTAILETTLSLISKNGFHATPMSMVAQQANVAAGTIYHYFDSKEILLDELYALLSEKIGTVILTSDDATRPYKERFRLIFVGLFKHFVENPDEFRFIEHYSSSPQKLIATAQTDQLLLPLWEFIRKGIHTNNLKDSSSKVMARLTYGSITALVKMKVNEGFTFDSFELNNAFHTVWDGFKR